MPKITISAILCRFGICKERITGKGSDAIIKSEMMFSAPFAYHSLIALVSMIPNGLVQQRTSASFSSTYRNWGIHFAVGWILTSQNAYTGIQLKMALTTAHVPYTVTKPMVNHIARRIVFVTKSRRY